MSGVALLAGCSASGPSDADYSTALAKCVDIEHRLPSVDNTKQALSACDTISKQQGRTKFVKVFLNANEDQIVHDLTND